MYAILPLLKERMATQIEFSLLTTLSLNAIMYCRRSLPGQKLLRTYNMTGQSHWTNSDEWSTNITFTFNCCIFHMFIGLIVI